MKKRRKLTAYNNRAAVEAVIR